MGTPGRTLGIVVEGKVPGNAVMLQVTQGAAAAGPPPPLSPAGSLEGKDKETRSEFQCQCGVSSKTDQGRDRARC